MFNSILFRRASVLPGNANIDLGALVEAMLFYGTTHIMVDRASLSDLIAGLRNETLLELVTEGHLRVTYVETWNGIRTDSPQGRPQLHDPVVFSSPQHRFPDVLRETCIQLLEKEGRGRRVATRLERHFQVCRHDPVITDGTRSLFTNDQYMELAARKVLAELVPGLDSSNFTFSAQTAGDRFVIASNINWSDVNKRYHRHVSPKHSTLSPAYILSHIFNVECDLYFASANSSELFTSPLNSKLISERVAYIVLRREHSQNELREFQATVFPEARSVREAINSGKVAVADLLPVIRRSAKFKNWLEDKPFDAALLAEYYREVTSKTIVDKLPGKSARWALFTGAGLAVDVVATGGIATATGLALGALDTFVLDKLLKGWKPDQFVEEELGHVLTNQTRT